MGPATALRAALSAGGAVATGAGLHTVLAGARSVAGRPPAGAGVESELRFYSAFYVAYGLALLHVAPRAERETGAVRALSATLFLAGVARAGGWLATGRPHPFQRVLLAVELTAPPAIVALQRAAAPDRGRWRRVLSG